MLVFNPDGQISSRMIGFIPERFEQMLTERVNETRRKIHAEWAAPIPGRPPHDHEAVGNRLCPAMPCLTRPLVAREEDRIPAAGRYELVRFLDQEPMVRAPG